MSPRSSGRLCCGRSELYDWHSRHSIELPIQRSREVTFGTDISINVINQLQPLAVVNLVEQIKPHANAWPEPQRSQIVAPLKLFVEGAGGNLLALGIQAMILKMLGIPPS
ncbi:hypothetical protein P0R31_06650 [Bradyrhizobium yuanmingense]|uniref:hypothetical protein n=1 Tax=Bradyrhizobium yuanmingense TaxID=108015 RepID=UPI0023B91484|nr:hypothetical protein [Bradyrhizobium yuanmingense]MDF0516905.1 hypothetical protein [Bradyrhizobium yuanmingense]